MKFSDYKIDHRNALVVQEIDGVKRLVASPEHLQYLLALDDLHVRRTRSTVIWRYMTFERAEKFLRSSRLYIPRVDKLKEPLEGSFCPPLEDAVYPEELKTTPERAQELAEEHAKFRKAFMQESFHVSCWHVCESESEMMWTRYLTGENGEKLNGVAVYTSIEKLLQLEPEPFDLAGAQVVPVRFAGDVSYIDHTIPGVIPSGELTLFYKDQAFIGDNEFRLIVKLLAFGWDQFDRSNWPQGFEIPFAPGSLIDGIVLRKSTSEEAEKRMRALVAHSPGITVRRSRMERPGIW